MSEKSGLRFNLIRPYCFTIIDANMIIHQLFDEEEFKLKIDYFFETSKKNKIDCELLPKTDIEITKKIYEVTNEFSNLIKKCKGILSSISRNQLENLSLDRHTAILLEKSFLKIFSEASRKNCDPKKKIIRMRRIRIIENLTMVNFWKEFGSKKNIKDFFDEMENDFGNMFKQIFHKQAIIMKNIGITSVAKKDIPETTDNLKKLFSKNCRIKNTDDIEFLCQAVSRMYDTDRWGIVISTDYVDIVKKCEGIWQSTFLTVCDPLYFLYKLENKLDLGLHPKKVASKYNVYFGKFFKNKAPIGVI